MDPIKEALTFDDVTLAPNYSNILPSDVNTTVKLAKYLNLKIDLSHFNTFHPSWNNQIEQEMEPILKGKLRSFHYRFDDERRCYND